eukprot:gene8922-biopygen4665
MPFPNALYLQHQTAGIRIGWDWVLPAMPVSQSGTVCASDSCKVVRCVAGWAGWADRAGWAGWAGWGAGLAERAGLGEHSHGQPQGVLI